MFLFRMIKQDKTYNINKLITSYDNKQTSNNFTYKYILKAVVL
jgi:hypothetical protein